MKDVGNYVDVFGGKLKLKAFFTQRSFSEYWSKRSDLEHGVRGGGEGGGGDDGGHGHPHQLSQN